MTEGPRSIFPDALNPALFINAWSGPPKTETGRPENVYSLDTTGMTPLKDENGETFRRGLQVGDGVELPDGKGSIQLDGWVRWVKLQVSDTPGVTISLVGDRVRGDRAVPVAVHPTPPGVGPTADRRGWTYAGRGRWAGPG